MQGPSFVVLRQAFAVAGASRLGRRGRVVPFFALDMGLLLFLPRSGSGYVHVWLHKRYDEGS